MHGRCTHFCQMLPIHFTLCSNVTHSIHALLPNVTHSLKCYPFISQNERTSLRSGLAHDHRTTKSAGKCKKRSPSKFWIGFFFLRNFRAADESTVSRTPSTENDTYSLAPLQATPPRTVGHSLHRASGSSASRRVRNAQMMTSPLCDSTRFPARNSGTQFQVLRFMRSRTRSAFASPASVRLCTARAAPSNSTVHRSAFLLATWRPNGICLHIQMLLTFR
jgi:hypothetical protein